MTPEPASPEAEQAVIGACLCDRDAILDVAARLAPVDFYQRPHQLIYAALLALYHERTPADILTVTERLTQRGELDAAGGEPYLAGLIESTPTSVHAGYYAGIVAEHAQRRRIIAAGQQIVRTAFDTTMPMVDVLTTSAGALDAAAGGKTADGTESIGAVMDRYVESLSNGPPEFTTFGYRPLDELIGGMEPASVTIVAGRPSMGKTGFAFGTAMHVAGKLERSVLMISLEMSNEQMVHRALAMRTGLDSRKIRAHHLNEHERWMVAEAARDIHAWPIEFARGWGDEVSLVIRQVRAFQSHRPLDLLVIDGLWLLHWPGAKGNRVQEVGRISRMVKLLAGELGVPVLMMHQLNRAMNQRAERVPVLSDLRESGDVEQDADMVIFVNRPGLLDESGKTPRDFAQIIVAKNRQGPVGRVTLGFDERTTTFHQRSIRVAAVA